MRLKYSLISILLLLPTIIYARQYYQFKQINSDHGLYNDQARRVTETNDGRIIIKTDGMISLYDGATFQFLRCDLNKAYTWTSFETEAEYIDPFDRLWIKDNYNLLLLDLNSYEFIYNIDEILSAGGVTDRLLNFFLDEDKNAWLFTERNQLYFYNWKDPAVLIYDGFLEGEMDYGSVADIVQMDHLFYIFFSNGSMRCYDLATHSFLYNDDYLEKMITRSLRRYLARKYTDTELLVLINGEAGGLFSYNVNTKQWQTIIPVVTLYDFVRDSDSNLWVTSREGLWIYNKQTSELEQYTSLKVKGAGEVEDNLIGICHDSTGGMWIATFSNGLLYYHPNSVVVNQVFKENGFTPGLNVRTILALDNGDILCGMNKGVYCHSPRTGEIYPYMQQLKTQFSMQLMKDSRGRVWLSTLGNGIYSINNGKVTNYTTSNVEGFIENDVRFCHEGPDGRLYVCNARNELGIFYPEEKKFISLCKQFPQIKRFRTITHIVTLNDSELMVGTQNGLFFYNIANRELYVPRPGRFPEDSVFNHSSRKYNSNLLDTRGLVWFGTQDGLNVWNPQTNVNFSFFLEDGLPNNCVQTVIEDRGGDIWVATSNGIARIKVIGDGKEKYEYLFFSLNRYDGVQRGEILERSAVLMRDGTLYIGGMNELNKLHPQDISWGMDELQAIFVRLSLFNTPVGNNGEYNGKKILDTPISDANELKLRYDQNFITLEFSALNYVNPSQTFFKYKLEGFDEKWTETRNPDGLGKVTYTGLRPGKYKFRVYAANTSKHWGEVTELAVTITPPFWATWWAYLLYTLITGLTVWYIAGRYLSLKRKKMIREQEEMSRQEQQKIDEMKFRFFTNISHEFRTPLTLIITPLEALLKKVDDASLKKQLELIHQSARDLLGMVNQLLDFRRLEKKGESLQISLVELTSFFESIFFSFNEIAKQKNIQFDLDIEPVEDKFYYLDQDKIHKIMNNLLSNAFKFTPAGGSVTLAVAPDSKGELQVTVTDTGVGIPEKDLSNVFTRFYQTRNPGNRPVAINTGSGIGLHLVKEYVELHKGKIGVESRENQGTQFVFTIPDSLREMMEQHSADKEEPGETYHTDTLAEVHSPSGKESKTTILIAEDNEKFREFLADTLSDTYTVFSACNGTEGLEIARNHNPDLIISDVMMPQMDGLEFCRHIKTDIKLSHIPVILLTAKNSPEYRTSGYEAGADSYISKPFNLDMLLMRIDKLLEQKDKRKEVFIKNIEVNPKSITITSLDEQLIQKALECVEKNISNTEFSVEHLSKEIGMDRTHLYRKMQAIIGQTPSDFIRTIRLKRAASLLETSQLTVAEISLMVGFNTQKYFSNYFKEMFHMTPSQYAQMKRKGEI